MNNNSRRLSIISAKEVDDLYGLPHFTADERHLYFALSITEREVINTVRTISVAVHLNLQLGYFKAKRQFFIYQQDAVIEDLNYILEQNFPGQRLASIKLPSRPTRIEQQQTIIKDISPVAWQHINLFGTFEFSPSTSNVDIEALVVRYADPTYWHKAIQDETESDLG